MSRQTISDADLRACAEAGMSAAQAARKLGVAHTTLSRHADRLGLVFAEGRTRKVTDADLRACAEAGLTQSETARKLRVSIQVVSARARCNGLQFPRGSRGGRRRARSADEVAALRACAEAGLSIAETVGRLGISRETVRIAARELGLVFRDGRRGPRPPVVSRADLLACAEAGMTMTEAAETLRLSVSTIHRHATDAGVIFKRGRRGPPPPAPRPDRAARPRTLAEAAALENAAAKAVWHAGEAA